MKVHKQHSAGDITSANNNSRSGSSKRLKTLRLCLAPRIKASAADASRIAHLEQLVGRLTVALDIEKKAAKWLP